jgi:hypothetical protein
LSHDVLAICGAASVVESGLVAGASAVVYESATPLGPDHEVSASGQDRGVVRKSPLNAASVQRRRLSRPATRFSTAIVNDHRRRIADVSALKPLE